MRIRCRKKKRRSAMFGRMFLASAIPCLVWATAGEGQTPSKQLSPSKDFHGDPLPAGALARLGSLRMRLDGGISDVAFSADNRTIAVAGAVIDKIEANSHIHLKSVLQLWDLASGKTVRNFKGL